MMKAVLFLWISWIPFVCAITQSTSWIASYNGELYLRHRNELRRLPSVHCNETISVLLGEDKLSLPIPGVKDAPGEFHYPERIQVLSQDDLVAQRLVVAADLPEVVMRGYSLDEKLRIHVARISALQGSPMLHRVMEIGPYINPSLLYFQRRWLVASCTSWYFPGMNDGRKASNTVLFKWTTQFTPVAEDGRLVFLARHQALLYSQQEQSIAPPQRKYMGISDILDDIQGETVEGQDPRVLALDEDSFLVLFVKERVRRRFHGLLHVNPMVVVQLDFQWNGEFAVARVVSMASLGHSSYRYGELRGGTNAVDLGDRFLAFFHSTVTLPGCFTKTYFMGAYTFSKTPPFRLLEMSSEPVVVPWLYEGPWNPFNRNRKIDYCVFPVSLSFLPPDSLSSQTNSSSVGHHVRGNHSEISSPFNPHRYRRDAAHRFDHGAPAHSRALNGLVDDHKWTGEHGDVSLLLTMGFQDLGGLLAVLSLQQVLRSLEPVVYCTDETAAAKHPVLFRLYCT
eukprot:gene11072-7877_t